MTITLTPIGIAQNALSPLVADEAKKAIVTLTRELTPELVQALIEKDVSLWRDCIPEGAREQFKEMAHSKAEWVRMINNGDLTLWVYEARPDLENVLSTPQGKRWLTGLLYEVRDALGR